MEGTTHLEITFLEGGGKKGHCDPYSANFQALQTYCGPTIAQNCWHLYGTACFHSITEIYQNFHKAYLQNNFPDDYFLIVQITDVWNRETLIEKLLL